MDDEEIKKCIEQVLNYINELDVNGQNLVIHAVCQTIINQRKERLIAMDEDREKYANKVDELLETMKKIF